MICCTDAEGEKRNVGQAEEDGRWRLVSRQRIAVLKTKCDKYIDNYLKIFIYIKIRSARTFGRRD